MSGSPPVLFTIDLPIPPSVNRIWRHGGRATYRSKVYLKWMKEANEAAGVQGKLVGYSWWRGSVAVVITVYRGKGWRKGRDLDNCAKVVMDWLRHHGHIKDDDWKHVTEVTVRMHRGKPSSVAFVEVAIRPDGYWEE